MTTINPVAVQFTGDARPFFAELTKVRTELGAARTHIQGVSQSIAKFGNVIKTALSFGAAALAIRAVVRATAEAEAAQAQLNNALQSAGANVKLASAEFQAYATQLQRTTTFSDEAIMQVQTLLLSFQGLSGEVVKGATAAVLDLSTRMGIDAPSAAKTLGKALSDPEKGLTALTRAGVIFTDSQKAQIKAMKDSGDLAGAQGLILKQLEERFGGAANAARNTFGGAISGLKNAFGDLLEGKGGINAASGAINQLTDVLSSPAISVAFAQLISFLATVITKAAEAAAGLAILFTGKGGNEVVDIDNMILKLQDEKKAIEKTLFPALSGGRRDLYAEENFKADKARLAEINGLIVAFEVQMDEIRERQRREAANGPRGSSSALNFTTGGTPEDEAESQKAIDARAKRIAESVKQTEETLFSFQQALATQAYDQEKARQKLLEDGQVKALERLKEYSAAQVADNQHRIEAEQHTQDSILSLRAGAINAGIGLLALLAQKSKAAAIALIAIEKAVAIGQAIRNTAVAVTNVMATVPFYAWGPAIASAKTLGAIQIGLIAATGALQIAGVASGGGGGGGGISAPNNRVLSDTAGDQQQGASSQRVLQVYFQGDVYGIERFKEVIGEVLSEGANERDIVYFSSNSRQAQEIRGS